MIPSYRYAGDLIATLREANRYRSHSLKQHMELSAVDLSPVPQEVTAPEGLPPVYYKAAIFVLLLLVLLITVLYLEVI